MHIFTPIYESFFTVFAESLLDFSNKVIMVFPESQHPSLLFRAITGEAPASDAHT